LADDPLHQFQIAPIEVFGTKLAFSLGEYDASFTNASLFMVAGTLAASAFMIGANKQALVPGRAQTAAETAYGFIHSMVKDAAGTEGVKKFFPFVFTLFMFIFMANMLGMFPYWFTTTSQIVIGATLALLVFGTVIIVGLAKNGLKFFKLFAPSGVPIYIMPLVVMIEIISFFSRPLSHSVRLWANILAGHILLKVFASFVPMLIGAGGLFTPLAILPMIMTVALYALEFLVAFLQAYVFALLTCIYFNDALHPGH
jgi:F-type H+-transporting ATPase subunit a